MYRLKKFIVKQTLDDMQRTLHINGWLQSYELMVFDDFTYNIGAHLDNKYTTTYMFYRSGNIFQIIRYQLGKIHRHFRYHENGIKSGEWHYKNNCLEKGWQWDISGKCIHSIMRSV